MDDDAGTTDPGPGPGEASVPAPHAKPSPPASRAVAMFAIVFVVLALIGAGAWFIGGSPAEPTFCTMEGRLDPVTGETYGRDPDQGCKFVDADGVVIPDQ